MLHTAKSSHLTILVAAALVVLFSSLSIAQSNSNTATAPSSTNTRIPRSTEDDRETRIDYLEKQIDSLRDRVTKSETQQETNSDERIALEEARQAIESRASLFRLMSYTFAGSGVASLLLATYLLYGLAGNSSYPEKETDSPEETLRVFHKQALSELKWYSAMSLVAMVFGVFIILGGALLALTGLTSAAIVSGVAGIVTEGVSLIFHTQTDKIRARVMDIERQLFNLRLARVINDKTAQDKAMDKILDSGLKTQYLPVGTSTGLSLQQVAGQPSGGVAVQ